jgi:16S rRNA (guanine966-N2)-methyltransferase
LASPRIISGKAGGIRLHDVPGDSTRPITDQVKEALFNILGVDIIDSTFLDLFGGTGSVGIEALSRGARFATFVENNHLAINIIKENLQKTKLGINSRAIFHDAFQYLKNEQDIAFSYIFIAPPQYKEMWKKALLLIDQKPQLLEDDGSVIVQIHPVEYEELLLTNFQVYESRKYGSTQLIFYEKRAN